PRLAEMPGRPLLARGQPGTLVDPPRPRWGDDRRGRARDRAGRTRAEGELARATPAGRGDLSRRHTAAGLPRSPARPPAAGVVGGAPRAKRPGRPPEGPGAVGARAGPRLRGRGTGLLPRRAVDLCDGPGGELWRGPPRAVCGRPRRPWRWRSPIGATSMYRAVGSACRPGWAGGPGPGSCWSPGRTSR